MARLEVDKLPVRATKGCLEGGYDNKKLRWCVLFLLFAKGVEIIRSLISSFYLMYFACVARHVSSWWVW